MEEANRAHRAPKAGVKAKKKTLRKKQKAGQSTERHNPRAFSVANVGRTKRNIQRNLDRAHKKEYVPLENRAEELPPPACVVVAGPPRVGKSTLIRSLVKMYTGQNLTDTTGPITVVAGKKRRFTFLECPNDLCGMIDAAKVADLVLLMIDASYGFEMETFEFLNILQLHGFPKVMGVLTHMDGMNVNKSLQKTKKQLKQRFWTEVYQGAKLFDLTGVINNKYPKSEVKRMTLYINRMKFRPLVWRNTHPYVLVDRVEDVTHTKLVTENPKCDRDIVLYGYVRGTHLKPHTRIHIIGAGDFNMAEVTALPDPCPLPEQIERRSLKSKDTMLYAPMSNVGGVRMDKDAVYIELSNVNYSKPETLDLTTRGGEVPVQEIDPETPAGLLKQMQEVRTTVDKKMRHSELQLFSSTKRIRASEVEDASDEDDVEPARTLNYGSDEDEDEDEDEDNEEDGADGYNDEETDNQEGEDGDEDDEDEDDEEDDEDEEEGDEDEEDELHDDAYDDEEEGDSHDGVSERGAEWKIGMTERAAANFFRRSRENVNLMELVYGKDSSKMLSSNADSDSDEDDNEGSDADSDDLFGEPKKKQRGEDDDDDGLFTLKKKKSEDIDAPDTSRFVFDYDKLRAAFDEQLSERALQDLRNRFVTGDWAKANKVAESDEEETLPAGADDDEVYGDFEDLETGEKFTGKQAAAGASDDEDGDDADEEDEEEAMERKNDEIDKQLRAENAAKKAAAKQKFDEEYDSKKFGASTDEPMEDDALEQARKLKEEQAARNKKEFGEEGEHARLRHEGFRQGLYVRIKFEGVPAEFSLNFRPQLPVILGGLAAQEANLGYIRARVKRHRWHRKVLKTNDPLIFSIGWRRFQSLPVYSIEDPNERNRHLKYTPEHMHCHATFYGPFVPPNTGVLAFQQLRAKTTEFRICMTGVVLELDQSFEIVKKLKLVGYPKKIMKNTAFVTGMFNSELEAAKFEGAKIKTVSGIRGQIKKALRNGEPGGFRATFEDKILMSDVVVCRVWMPVDVKKFYNPVTTLLENDPQTWDGIRPISRIRKEEKIPISYKKESIYKPVERMKRQFSTLKVPRSLQENLPFASKPKNEPKKKRSTYMAKRAVVLEPEDRRKRGLIQMLSTLRKEKETIREQSQKQRREEKLKQKQREAAVFEDIHKSQKKRKYQQMGMEQARKRRAEGLDG